MISYKKQLETLNVARTDCRNVTRTGCKNEFEILGNLIIGAESLIFARLSFKRSNFDVFMNRKHQL